MSVLFDIPELGSTEEENKKILKSLESEIASIFSKKDLTPPLLISTFQISYRNSNEGELISGFPIWVRESSDEVLGFMAHYLNRRKADDVSLNLDIVRSLYPRFSTDADVQLPILRFNYFDALTRKNSRLEIPKPSQKLITISFYSRLKERQNHTELLRELGRNHQTRKKIEIESARIGCFVHLDDSIEFDDNRIRELNQYLDREAKHFSALVSKKRKGGIEVRDHVIQWLKTKKEKISKSIIDHQSNSTIKACFIIPAFLLKEPSPEGARLKGFGGCCIIFDEHFSSTRRHLEALDETWHKINLVFGRLGTLDWIERAQNALLSSAANAIMTRNFSHNIGSHVVSSVAQIDQAELLNLSRIGRRDIVPEWKDAVGTDTIIKEILEHGLQAERTKEIKTVLEQRKSLLEYSTESLSALLSYIQGRFDFLAAVASGEINTYGKITLDELQKKFNEQKLLLEKLKFSGTIKVDRIELDFKPDPKEAINDYISLPFNDEVGAHAIYSILENYIRNVLKYNKSKEDILRITVYLERRGTNLIRARLTSNTKIEKTPTKSREEFIGDIAKTFENPILLDKAGNIEAKSWGLKEMLICGALLRKRPLYDINNIMKFIEKEESLWAKLFGPSDVHELHLVRHNLILDERDNQFEDYLNKKDQCNADFLLVGIEKQEIVADHWDVLPARVAFVGRGEISDRWLRRRVVRAKRFANKTANIETDWEIYNYLLQQWTKRITTKVPKEIILRGYRDSKAPKIIKSEIQKLPFQRDSTVVEFNHDITKLTRTQRGRKVTIPFSHDPSTDLLYTDYFRFFSEKESSKNPHLVNSKVLELLSIWKSQILIIDSRIEKNMRKYKEDLSILCIDIISEDVEVLLAKRDTKITIINTDQNGKKNKYHMSSYHFFIIHLGCLETKARTLYEKEGEKDKAIGMNLPAFVFIVTGRGTKPNLDEMPHWAKKIFSISALQSWTSFRHEKSIFTSKIKLVKGLLTL